MSEVKYRVEVVLKAPGQEPVTICYLKAGSPVSVMRSVTTILSQEEEGWSGPSSVEPELVSVTVTPVKES